MTIQANFPNVLPSLLLDFANANQLDPRVTFTRATTAAYYDDNTTAMAEQNLLQYSQQMNTSPWETVVATATEASTTAPDGTSTGNTINQSSTGVARVRQTQAFSNAVTHTFSAYVKAGTSNYAAIAYSEQNWECYAKINLSTGAIQEAGNFTGRSSYVSSSITSVGNSWYRVTLTFVAVSGSSTDYIHIITTDSTTWVGRSSPADTTSAGTVLAWGAQLEQRSSATAYTVTTTQPITNYVPVLMTAGGGQPRFDHNPTTRESLGLLIEEARTNVCLQSANFTTTWSAANQVSITSNTIVAPDGTLTGDKLIADATSNVHYVVQNTGNIAAPWTFSCYAKAGEYSRVGFSYSNTGYVFFNLSTGVQEGTVGGGITSTSITSVGNGWYRVSFTSTSTGSGANIGIYLFNGAYSSGVPTFTGDGFSGLYIWGAQAEAGAFPTSYIPTTNAAATRAADTVVMTGQNLLSWFNAGQGTFYGDGNLSGGGRYFHTVKSGSSAQIEGVQQTSTFDAFIYTTDVQANINISANSFTNHRVALRYQTNGVGACVDAGAVSEDNTAVMPLDLNAFYVNSYGSSGPLGSGTIKKVAYYPIALTNAQLQALTS
jgi:hypothetical protein